MVTSLGVLSERCGTGSGPELVVALQGMPTDDLGDVVEDLLSRAWLPVANRPPGEVWPLVNSRTSTFTTGGSNQWYTATAGQAGLNLVAAIDPRATGTGQFPSGVLRALLYGHGLVIEDPVLLAAEMYAGAARESRRWARASVEAAVASMSEIAVLVDAGVVDTFFTTSADQHRAAVLAEALMVRLDEASSGFDVSTVWDSFEVGYVEGVTAPLRELWRRVRAGDRSPPLDLVGAAAQIDPDMAEVFVQVLAELRPRGVVENAVSVVASAIADIAHYEAPADLLCPSRLFAELAFIGKPDPCHAMRLHQLAQIEVPRLDDLLIEDAVQIRQGSESFARWRQDLSVGLERAQNLQLELGPDVDATEVVGEVLAAARQDLLREVGASSSLSNQAGVMSFVAGGLGGALGGAAGGVAGVGLGAAGGVAPTVLQAAFSPRTIETFLERHYVLFERPSS